MSAVFQSGYSNLGQRALERATDAANKYNQKLKKKEMVSQTEESLGGIKAFTSGRELFKSIGEKSKLKPYLKQEADKHKSIEKFYDHLVKFGYCLTCQTDLEKTLQKIQLEYAEHQLDRFIQLLLGNHKSINGFFKCLDCINISTLLNTIFILIFIFKIIIYFYINKYKITIQLFI